MRNRFSPGCTTCVVAPEGAVVGTVVGVAVGAAVGAAVEAVVGAVVSAVVETGVEVGAVVGVSVATATGVGVAAWGLGVGVVCGAPSEVGLGEAMGTTVRPVAAAAVAAGVNCTSETATVGLARLQPAIGTTRSRVKATTTRQFFFVFMTASSFSLERATAIKFYIMIPQLAYSVKNDGVLQGVF